VSAAASVPVAVPGRRGAKNTRRKVLFVFGAVLGLVLGLSVLAIALAKPEADAPPCPPEDPVCGRPPVDDAPPLVSGVLWKGSAAGVQMEYYPRIWKVVDQDAENLKLKLDIPGRSDIDLFLWVRAVPASSKAPSALAQERVSDLRGSILGLEEDTDPKHALLGPSIGYVDGDVGAAYSGATDTPQGPGSPASVLLMAATDGQASAVVSVASTFSDRHIFGLADSLLNTFRWPSQPAPQAAPR